MAFCASGCPREAHVTAEPRDAELVPHPSDAAVAAASVDAPCWPCSGDHGSKLHATFALPAGSIQGSPRALGHATVAITLDTYSHAIPAMQEAAVRIAALVSAPR